MKTLKQVVIVMAIIAVFILAIAGGIKMAKGALRAMARCAIQSVEAGRAGTVAVDERKSIPIKSINRIAINAVSENITIREASGDNITAWFHGNISSASPDDRPHLKVDQQGDTAEIRIERRIKEQMHVNLGLTQNNAVLEVSIPKQYAGKLSAESVSADITLESHGYRKLALTTVSGDIEADAVKAGKLTLYTTSGDVRIQRLAIERAEIHSVSGDVAITGDVDAYSTSGSIDIETVSGDVRLGMSPNAKFTLDARSTSGNVTCDFPITLTSSNTDVGEHNLIGTVGSGKGAVTARTVSGDIEITRN